MPKKDGSAIIGQRIISVREDDQNVDAPVLVVELETGSVLFPVSNPDGSGKAGGLLYREIVDGPAALLVPEGAGPAEPETDEERGRKKEMEARREFLEQALEKYTRGGGPAGPFQTTLPDGSQYASAGLSVLDHAALELAKAWLSSFGEDIDFPSLTQQQQVIARCYEMAQAYQDRRAGEEKKPSREELVDALEDAALLISATNSALVDGPGDVRIRLYGPDKPSTTFMQEAQDVFKRAMDFVHRAKGEPQEETEG